MSWLSSLESFRGDRHSAAMHDTWHVAVAAIVCYVAFIFIGQRAMRDRPALELRSLSRMWNLSIAVFSIAGAIVSVPTLVGVLRDHGVRYSVCTRADAWYHNGVVGIFAFAFMWSKFFEFIDTIFLVLRKREVIFLHWYHHVTVLLFSWHAVAHRVGNGFWFCTVNYSIHAIMYSYYFLMGFSLTRPIMRPIAPVITSLQILQMALGLIILTLTTLEASAPSPTDCHVDAENVRYGLLMYASYLVLFCHFFYVSYLSPSAHAKHRRSHKHVDAPRHEKDQ